MKVGLLTIEQKDLLVGQKYSQDSYFNPTLDGDNNWFISTQEMDACIYPQFYWVKDLPLIDWVEPIPIPPMSDSTENYV